MVGVRDVGAVVQVVWDRVAVRVRGVGVDGDRDGVGAVVVRLSFSLERLLWSASHDDRLFTSNSA